MKAHTAFRSATANVVIGLGPALIGPIAIAETLADVPPKPTIEIDEAALKIDLVAALRAIRASLESARVSDGHANAKREVKLAAAERRDPG